MIKRIIENWRFAFYEIQNWFFIKSIIRKHSKTADWKNYNLRADWVGRIYTVINPQSPGDDGDTMEVLRIKYTDRLKPMNIYLDSLGLGESVTLAYEQIKDSKSFVFVYTPLFRVITTWRVIWISGLITIFFGSRLDSLTYKGLSYAITGITNLLGKIF
jgi:hypothetical protein